MCPFFSLCYARNLYITAAGHYVRRSLTHFTVRVGPGGRWTAAASHLPSCAVGLVILPYFRLCNLLLVSSNPARCVLTGAGANLEVKYLGTSESEVRRRLAEVPSQGVKDIKRLPLSFNFSIPKRRSMTPCKLLQIRHPLPLCAQCLLSCPSTSYDDLTGAIGSAYVSH